MFDVMKSDPKLKPYFSGDYEKKTDKIVLNITGNNCGSRLKNFIKINLMQNVAWN